MTRIIAGSLGGRRIKVPPRGTRPTTDRVREAIFGRLEAAGVIEDARVVDVFAGSGALGIEALSRGAACVVFVEAAASATRVIEGNLRVLGVAGKGTVVRSEALAFLKREGERFDLALLDPPYDLPSKELVEILAALATRLTPGARVVLEWPSRGEPPEWPPGIMPQDVRRYGETSVHYVAASKQAMADGGGGPVEGSVEP